MVGVVKTALAGQCVLCGNPARYLVHSEARPLFALCAACMGLGQLAVIRRLERKARALEVERCKVLDMADLAYEVEGDSWPA